MYFVWMCNKRPSTVNCFVNVARQFAFYSTTHVSLVSAFSFRFVGHGQLSNEYLAVMLDPTKFKRSKPIRLAIYPFYIAMREWCCMGRPLANTAAIAKSNMSSYWIDCARTIQMLRSGECFFFKLYILSILSIKFVMPKSCFIFKTLSCDYTSGSWRKVQCSHASFASIRFYCQRGTYTRRQVSQWIQFYWLCSLSTAIHLPFPM